MASSPRSLRMAAPPGHDLLEGGGGVERHRPPELNVQGLIGDGERMAPVQGAQGLQVGPGNAPEADAV